MYLHKMRKNCAYKTKKETIMGKFGKGDTSWFVKDRFGMFIHWGLYSSSNVSP